MRLIDADKLIDFIDVGHLRHPGELCFSEVDVVNMLNHAPTAHINKSTEHINKSSDCSTGWIPCSERLPETEDDVLVWYRYRMMQGVNIVGVTKRHGIGYYYKPTGSWLIYDGFGLDQNVIAWMPLPEPWKGEQGRQRKYVHTAAVNFG